MIKEEYREELKPIGAKLITPERKMRRSILRQHFNPQLKSHYVRVRDEGNKVRVSAKIHAEEGGQIGDQKEVDIEVSDYDRAIKLIEMMGFNFNSYQETLRETWEYDGAEITIDTWPGLLPYSEIEANSAEHVHEIANKLNFNWDKKIITSVVEVYMKVYGISMDEVHKRTVNCTFENNPFADLTPNNSWAK